MRHAEALTLLYRGTLSSCNYDCRYCPFAKRTDSAATMAQDRREVQRFVDWCAHSPRPLELLFTPWGEALVRAHYREALVRLSHMGTVQRVGIQTNLSRSVEWLRDADPAKVSLWCTFHPSQVERARFLRRVARLAALGVGHSVGMVALREDVDEIRAMRTALPATTYLWLNALDPRGADYYVPADIDALIAIDPHFAYQLQPQPSLGARCRAGDSALSVDGAGNVRPCHFLAQSLGNLYDGSFEAQLRPRPCSNTRCDCYIGYALRTDLAFDAPLLRQSAPAS